MAMCYLCAYVRAEVPQTVDPLSPPPLGLDWTQALGTCHTCSVWACSMHATRYGVGASGSFQCAICTPAQAVKVATGVDQDPVAVAEALRVAPGADSPEAHRFDRALTDVMSADSRQAWLSDFAGSIPFVDPAAGAGLMAGYPPAMAAAVGAVFAGRDLRLRADAGQIAAGAVTLAYEVAQGRRGGPPLPLLRIRNRQLIDPVVLFIDFVERSSRG